MKFLKIFAALMIRLVNQLMLSYFCKFVNMSKEKYQKLNYWQEEKTMTNCSIYREGVIIASKAHSLLTKINNILKPAVACVKMWSSCQNMSGLSFTNPDNLPWNIVEPWKWKLQTKFFELINKKHKNFVISERGLFLDRKIVLLE